MGEKPLKSLQEKKRRSAAEASGDRKQSIVSLPVTHSLWPWVATSPPSLWNDSREDKGTVLLTSQDGCQA